MRNKRKKKEEAMCRPQAYRLYARLQMGESRSSGIWDGRPDIGRMGSK
jgi:hypothetical protein